MADLEKMLLEAAGRKDTTDTNPNPITSSRSSKVLFSHDSDNGCSNSKTLGSQVPLRKRMFIANEGDGSKGNDNVREYYDGKKDSEDDSSSVGSVLHKGDNEITHVTRSKSARQSAMRELVKQRKHNAAARKVSGRRYSHVTKRNPGKNKSSYSKSIGEVSTDASEATDHGDSSDHDEDDLMSRAKYEDVKKITISRSKLEKWFREPFFEGLIMGCFVRIGIGRTKQHGPIYRLCVVRNVDATVMDRTYKFGNRYTHKFLNVVWGSEDSAARWQMAVVSNSPPSRHEFDQLVEETNRYGGFFPTKQEVLEKLEDIKKTKSFVYSAETVKQMLEEKRSTGSKPFNVAAEKVRLRDELEKIKDDEAEVERIKARLNELETLVHGKHTIDKKVIGLEQMNKKNKVENLTANTSKPSPMRCKGLPKAGNPGYDPFPRRWTHLGDYFPTNESSEADKKGTLAAEEAMDEAERAGKLVDMKHRHLAFVQGTDEFIKLRDFKLPISLSKLQEFGGPDGFQMGHLARRMQLEANYNRSIVQEETAGEDDGENVLTLDGYQRRRGLI